MASLLIIAVFGVLFVFCFIYMLSLYIRRWHDLGCSGWWTLVNFVPLINLLALIYLIFAKGAEGANQYGAPNAGQPFWRSVFSPGSLATSPAQPMAAAPPLQPAPPQQPPPTMPPPPPAAPAA